jgi:hypothetical protein
MKHGHCEYFASAHVVMCRLLDVPARLATGFRVDERRKADADTYVVRARDAHAWSEVYTQAGGWELFDPTPAAAVGDVGTWARMKDAWESLQFLWREKVIGYDLTSWKKLMGLLGSGWASIRAAAGEWKVRLEDSATNLLARGYVDSAMVRLVITIGLLGLILEVLFVLGVFRRRKQERIWTIEKYGVGPEQLEFYRKLLGMLSRRGIKLHSAQTPREWVDRAARPIESASDAMGELIDLYYGLRWGRMR